MTQLRVLHVVGDLELGGGQKLTALVARSLDQSRFQVSILSLGGLGAYGAALQQSGVEVLTLGLRQPLRANSTLQMARAARGLVRLLWGRPWDVVHTHMFSSAAVVTPLAWARGARVFGTAHRVYYGRRQGMVERALSPLQEKIVVDSSAVREILRETTRIPERRYAVIHNGIDVREFPDIDPADARTLLAIPGEAFVVGQVAHLEPHKGQAVLLRAVHLARQRVPQLHAVLVGGGTDRARLEELADELRIRDAVSFLGPRNDLNSVLAALDVLALPSTFEGFGIVHAEAMYKRLPVIGTDRGGATEVVVHGETGILTRFGDSDAIADAICELAGDPALRQRYGDAGRQRVERMFTADVMVRQYERLYEAARRPRSWRPRGGSYGR